MFPLFYWLCLVSLLVYNYQDWFIILFENWYNFSKFELLGGGPWYFGNVCIEPRYPTQLCVYRTKVPHTIMCVLNQGTPHNYVCIEPRYPTQFWLGEKRATVDVMGEEHVCFLASIRSSTLSDFQSLNLKSSYRWLSKYLTISIYHEYIMIF